MEKLVDLDVQITHQQHILEDAMEKDEHAIFQVDLPDASSYEIAKMRQNAEELDVMMAMLFEFIHLTCGQRRRPLDLPNGGLLGSPSLTALPTPPLPPALPLSHGEQTPSEVLFEALISAFRTSVMQTYKCRSRPNPCLRTAAASVPFLCAVCALSFYTRACVLLRVGFASCMCRQQISAVPALLLLLLRPCFFEGFHRADALSGDHSHV